LKLKTACPGLCAIWHSKLERAVRTADIIAQDLSLERGALQCRDYLAPEGSAQEACKKIAAYDRDLLIVSHMPLLGALPRSLTKFPQAPSSFATGMIMAFERDRYGLWHLLWDFDPGMQG
ncbi:MAG: hypothetical protein AABZ44_03040, partial [Elusimicrobiota bacterium]